MFSSIFAKVFASTPPALAATAASVKPPCEECAAPIEEITVAVNPYLIKRIAQVKAAARAYEHGLGVPEDMDKAISLYIEGAELGGAYAIFKLAGFYAEGISLPLDREMAAMWYKKGMQLHPQEPVFASKYECLMTNPRTYDFGHHKNYSNLII